MRNPNRLRLRNPQPPTGWQTHCNRLSTVSRRITAPYEVRCALVQANVRQADVVLNTPRGDFRIYT
jgi:hypothetical protein